ncbi:MAG: MBL fold metallo-hydrolase [Bdellovibrionaceae bacterium]|nr:MBL fold metallo-hydrolase [Pseudobdellovibrionaceae bacterium]
MTVKEFFDPDTFTLSYIVFDSSTKDSVVIDPVLNYDPKSSTYSLDSVGQLTDFIHENKLTLHYILETHAHADHLSGSQFLKQNFPKAKVAIGENITKVQDLFKNYFNLSEEFKADGSQFDELLVLGKVFYAGSLWFKTLPTPGHTPACCCFLTEGAVFSGDTLFMPDYGTGRCDFPSGSAEDLYESITKQLYTLPDNTIVYVGHDYLPNGRGLKCASTIGDEKRDNIRLKATTKKEEFIRYRETRDAELETPKLLLQSIQTNIRAGNIPSPESNQISYLKIPIQLKPSF